MIRALVFDFDGLILDTETPDYQVWQEIYASYGCTLPLSAWVAALGTSADAFDACGLLEGQLGRPLDRATIEQQAHRRRLDLITAQGPLPGVERTLAEARQRGLKLGLASSSSAAWVKGHLARLGLLEAFDCIRCADDVQQVKPDPELYRAAVAGLGVQPREAVALEDAPNGVLAARRAGLWCVFIPNTVIGSLAHEQADLQITSLADWPLERLLAEVVRQRA